jgi:hypothetical protein
LSQTQFASDRPDRHTEHTTDLLSGETAEKLQLDDTALSFVEFGELTQSLIQHQKVRGTRLSEVHSGFQGDPRAGASLAGLSFPRMIDQHAPHDARRHRKKVRPVVHVQRRLIRQPEVGLMNQRSRLKSAVAGFAIHLRPRKANQIVVDDRSELL